MIEIIETNDEIKEIFYNIKNHCDYLISKLEYDNINLQRIHFVKLGDAAYKVNYSYYVFSNINNSLKFDIKNDYQETNNLDKKDLTILDQHLENYYRELKNHSFLGPLLQKMSGGTNLINYPGLDKIICTDEFVNFPREHLDRLHYHDDKPYTYTLLHQDVKGFVFKDFDDVLEENGMIIFDSTLKHKVTYSTNARFSIATLMK